MASTEIYELHRSDSPYSSTVEETYDTAYEALAQAQRAAASEDASSRTIYEVMRVITEEHFELVWSSYGD